MYFIIFHFLAFIHLYLLDLSDIHQHLSLIVKKKKTTCIYGPDGLSIFVNVHVRKLFVLCFIINLSYFHHNFIMEEGYNIVTGVGTRVNNLNMIHYLAMSLAIDLLAGK